MRNAVLTRCCHSLLCMTVVGLTSSSARGSISYSGEIENDGTAPDHLVLEAGQNWQSGKLEWVVTDNMNGTWNYWYQFSHSPASPNTSHFTFEISLNVDDIGLLTGLDGNFEAVELGGTGLGQGQSNPGLPAAGFTNSVKFEFDDQEPVWVTFDIARVPTWGDFYAKGGQNGNVGYAYNSGFSQPDPLATAPADGPLILTVDGVNYAKVLVPDSQSTTTNNVVPEATSIIMWAVLAGVCGVGARRRQLFV